MDGNVDVCSWLPAGPLKMVGSTTIDPITEIDDIDRSTGIVAKCIKGYSDRRDLTLDVTRYDTVANAGRVFERVVGNVTARDDPV